MFPPKTLIESHPFYIFMPRNICRSISQHRTTWESSSVDVEGRCKTSWYFKKTSTQFANNFARRIRARCARQTIPRVRARTAKEKSANRRLVTRPIQNGPHRKQLIERKLAMKHMPARKSVR